MNGYHTLILQKSYHKKFEDQVKLIKHNVSYYDVINYRIIVKVLEDVYSMLPKFKKRNFPPHNMGNFQLFFKVIYFM